MAKASVLLLTVVASVPIQLNKFFFSSESLVVGIPVDYRAISVYLSDFLIIAYVIFFVASNFKNLPKLSSQNKFFTKTVLALNIYLLSALFFQETFSPISVWRVLKIIEFSLLVLCAQFTLRERNVQKSLAVVLLFSVIWQSLLVFFQFAGQRSLNLWFLGERSFDSTTVSIAHSQLFGKQFLRPYGTFPHPNIAAAFFVIASIVMRKRLFQRLSPSSLIAVGAVASTLVLTYSQAALLSLNAAVIVLARSLKIALIGIFLLAILTFGFFSAISGSQLASVAERLLLVDIALDVSLKNPVFGVGNANFIPELAKLDVSQISQVRLLQPVHNVFFLVLAENGVLGLLLLMLTLSAVFSKVKTKEQLALGICLLIFASLDHFFWTLQQGQLLFWLTCAYIIASPKTSAS